MYITAEEADCQWYKGSDSFKPLPFSFCAVFVWCIYQNKR